MAEYQTMHGPVYYGPDDGEVDQFLKCYVPSQTRSTEAGPWIWVRKSRSIEQSRTEMEEASAVVEGKTILDDVIDKIQSIEVDASIPVRSTKAVPINKLRAREAIFKSTKTQLYELAKKYNYTGGKWLFFDRAPYCDHRFAKIAKSLISGPLKDSPAMCVKVSTTDDGPLPGDRQHVICLYLPDIYDRSSVKQVLDVLIKRHGIEPGSAKPDFYTAIGLDSQHPSRMPPVLFRPTDFYKKDEIKAMLTSEAKLTSKSKTKESPAKTQKISRFFKSEGSDDLTKQLQAATIASKPAISKKREIKDVESESDTSDDFVPMPKVRKQEDKPADLPKAQVTKKEGEDPDATDSDSDTPIRRPDLGQNLRLTKPTGVTVDPESTESDSEEESLSRVVRQTGKPVPATGNNPELEATDSSEEEEL